MTGHKTRAVFDRYHIVSPGVERAAALLDKHHQADRARAESGHRLGTVATIDDRRGDRDAQLSS
jgi:hypothetical protein